MRAARSRGRKPKSPAQTANEADVRLEALSSRVNIDAALQVFLKYHSEGFVLETADDVAGAPAAASPMCSDRGCVTAAALTSDPAAQVRPCAPFDGGDAESCVRGRPGHDPCAQEEHITAGRRGYSERARRSRRRLGGLALAR
jgi:hypothetical protein